MGLIRNATAEICQTLIKLVFLGAVVVLFAWIGRSVEGSHRGPQSRAKRKTDAHPAVE